MILKGEGLVADMTVWQCHSLLAVIFPCVSLVDFEPGSDAASKEPPAKRCKTGD